MVIWLIGLSGAGKTTLGAEVVNLAREKNIKVVFIDGDVIRDIFEYDLGYSLADRKKNAKRICALCKFLDDQGINVVCAILSIFHESQQWNREYIKNYYEVFIDAPFELLRQIDYKGLYQKAFKGEIKNVVGVDIEFPPPQSPDKIIHNTGTLKDLLANAPDLVKLLS